jgi:LCP family protein required for cell wall assembly
LFGIKKKDASPVDNIKKNDSHISPIDKVIKPKRKILKIVLVFIFLTAFAVLSWVGVGAFAAISKVVTKNQTGSAPFLGLLGKNKINANELQGEGDGRINILLIGIGGANHPGGMLTDTILVASIDPENNKVAFLSIPRDLYVPIEGYGNAKINYAHAYGEANSAATGGGPAMTKKTVSTILDLPIHYYIRADFDGLTKLIDELGGVTIDVKKTLSDPYYPAANMVDYQPFYLKAGVQTLDGKTALKFARSRETTSDFDRAARQQQLLVAIRDKALSLNVLTNPKKIVDIMGIVGDHVRTDMQMWEIEKLVSILKDVDTTNMVSKVLDTSSDGPLTSANFDGGYYIIPKAGIGKFGEVQRIAHEIFSDPYLSKENARVEIINATGQTGAAKDVQDTLVSYGYNVTKISKDQTAVNTSSIYDYTNGKVPFTVEFLKKRFNATVKVQPQNSDAIDITLVLGKDYLTVK